MALAWASHGARTGLSPLAPGQWAPFLSLYLALCAAQLWLRPARLAAALLLTPAYEVSIRPRASPRVPPPRPAPPRPPPPRPARRPARRSAR
jgi:hypothetical protein